MVVSIRQIEKVFTKKALKKFQKFMFGQTMTIGGFYEEDLIRFIKELPVID